MKRTVGEKIPRNIMIGFLVIIVITKLLSMKANRDIES